MWNQILNPPKSPYYSYANKRKEQLAKLSKYKLFILLISRATYRVMRESILHLNKITKQQQSLLAKVWNCMRRSAVAAHRFGFDKLKQNALQSRRNQTMVKNITILLERMLKYKLKKTFSTILLFGQRKNQCMISNIEHMRKIIFCRKIQKVFLGKRKNHFQKINEYSHFVKKVLKKVKLAGMISSRYLKNVKQACFNRLSKNMLVQRKQNSVKQRNQTEQLKQQLNEITQQLETKNVSIGKLQQQIQQLKMEQSSNNYNSFSEYTTTFYGNNQNRSRSITRSRKGANQSVDSGLDFSLGSILGNSFSLNKSRSKDMRKGDSIASIDCNCGYKEKYIKYKNSNDSLKNQLEIVKEELEVAKDLNDHFTNEIRQYFGGQKDSIELDRLKKQCKDLQKQRQELRMKVTKYQHHITTLKSQFKVKIQELYRKVKKQR